MEGLRRFARFYNHLLHRYKYPTQIVTGGILWCTGDILCQGLVYLAQDEQHQAGPDKLIKLGRQEPFVVDWERVARMTTYGLLFSAPSYAFWYSFLDKWSYQVFGKIPPGSHPPVPRIPDRLLTALDRVPPLARRARDGPAMATFVRTWKIIAFKLWADCFIFDPLYLTLFFSATGAMEGKGLSEIGEKLRHDLLPTYIVDVAVWGPIQTVNFRFVPVPYQSLVVQACNIGWNAYLSFVQHGAH